MADVPASSESALATKDLADSDEERGEAQVERKMSDFENLLLTLWDKPRANRGKWETILANVQRQEGKRLDPVWEDDVISGKFSKFDIPAALKLDLKMCRMFLSSTFTDTKWERDLIIADVLPFLTEYGRKAGVEFFQPSEMRWGIRETTAAAHLTSEVCMSEIERCQAESDGITYVAILADKYGYRPFPPLIAASEWQKLYNFLSDSDNVAAEMMNQWFLLDDNRGCYVLQPSSLVSEAEWWGSGGNKGIFPTLQLALRKAAMSVLTPERSAFYEMSVTQEEVLRGCLFLPAEERNRKTFIYRRKIVGDKSKVSRNFIDFQGASVDEDAQQRLAKLRDQIVFENLDLSRLKEYEIKSDDAAPVTEITPSTHPDYLKNFCDDFCLLAIEDINQISAEKTRPIDIVLDEVLLHLTFMQHRVESFSVLESHASLIEKICKYLETSPATQPFIVQGESGSGKSSLMAYLVTLCEKLDISRSTEAGEAEKKQDGEEKKAAVKAEKVIIQRYLGTTADSSSIRLLLFSLCSQLARIYNPTLTPSSDYTTLLKEFAPKFLSLATAEKPLFLFLDSLDQLSDENNGRRLDWLPFSLPPHTHIVVSTLLTEGPCYSVIQAKLGKDNKLEAAVCPLQPEDGKRILDMWLETNQRKFTPPQRQLIEEKFLLCPSPLWLKIVLTTTAKEWKSYTTELHLADSITQLLAEMFEKLMQVHGRELVSRVLGLITASKNGLSSTELLDILALDEEVLDSVFEWWTPPTRRLPPLCLTRVESDLANMLQRRGADGSVPVWSWFHRQCLEVARKMFLNEEQAKKCRTLLVDYFSGKWAGKAKPYGKVKEGEERKTADRWIARQDLYLQKDVPNLRRLSELPHALLGLEDWKGAEKLICNMHFIEAMCKAGRLYDAIGHLNLLLTKRPSDRVKQYALMLKNNALVLNSYPSVALSTASFTASNTLTFQDAEKLYTTSQKPHFVWTHGKPAERPRIVAQLMGGHHASVVSVALTDDRQLLYSGGMDGCVSLWQVASGELLNSISAVSKDAVYGLYVHTKSKSLIVVCGDTGLVQRRHLTTLELQQEYNMFPRLDERDLAGTAGEHVIFGDARRMLSKSMEVNGKFYLVISNVNSHKNHSDVIQVLDMDDFSVKGSLPERADPCWGLGVSYAVKGEVFIVLGYGQKKFRVHKATLANSSDNNSSSSSGGENGLVNITPNPIFENEPVGPDRAPMLTFGFSHNMQYMVCTNTSHGCYRDLDEVFVYDISNSDGGEGDSVVWKQVAAMSHGVGFQFATHLEFTLNDEFLIAPIAGVLKIFDMKNFKLVKHISEKTFVGFSMGLLDDQKNGVPSTVAISTDNGVTVLDTDDLFDTTPQEKTPTLFNIQKGVGINIRVHPDGKSFITCLGGNVTGPIYTLSIDSFRLGKPHLIHQTKSRPHVFSNGICWSKQGTLYAVCGTSFVSVHNSSHEEKTFGSGQNCCFANEEQSLIVFSNKEVHRVDDVMGEQKESWRIPLDLAITSMTRVANNMIVGGSDKAVVVDQANGNVIQTLPLEPRGCTGVTSFEWEGSTYLLISCDKTRQLTLWKSNEQQQFVQIDVLLDLNATTDVVVRTYIEPGLHPVYFVFTSFGVLLRYKVADLMKFAQSAVQNVGANDNKSELGRPVPFDILRLPVSIHDAFVTPEGDGVLFVASTLINIYQRSVQFVAADGMNLWNE